jgi:hypothetical protein
MRRERGRAKLTELEFLRIRDRSQVCVRGVGLDFLRNFCVSMDVAREGLLNFYLRNSLLAIAEIV